jgi:hypothetical protein
MLTVSEFFYVVESAGVPLTDAIRAEISRDQSDRSKWALAPARFTDLCEPDPDQSRAERQRAFLLEQAKTRPSQRRWNPKTGVVVEHYPAIDEIAVTVLRWKPGVDPATALRPQLYAQPHYVEDFIRRYTSAY